MSINWGFFETSLSNLVGLAGLVLFLIVIFQVRGGKISRSLSGLAIVAVALVMYGMVAGHATTGPALTSAILNTGTTSEQPSEQPQP